MSGQALSELKFRVSEIFFSIQGEGTRAGRPCIFVRLGGCNLECSWCDTIYAREINAAYLSMSGDEIVEKISSYKCKFVELTGGEPLLQAGSALLLKHLCDLGYECAIETNGSLDVSVLDARVIKIMDLKCPGSGMAGRMNFDNIRHLLPSDEVKFVISCREDFDRACEITEKYALAEKCGAVIFSPVAGACAPAELAGWVLASGLDVRMQVQMHKIIWPPDARGV